MTRKQKVHFRYEFEENKTNENRVKYDVKFENFDKEKNPIMYSFVRH